MKTCLPGGGAISSTTLRVLSACLLAICLGAVGCVGFKTVNEPIEKHDPEYGYRPQRPEIRRDRGDVNVYLAFSGGGTRAAAFAYGVMQTLEETTIPEAEVAQTLLQEVDTVSGVSGGSFPAAYYGLFENRIFDDFEERFLRRNIQGGIIWRTLVPWNLVALLTPWLSRSDIAKGIYDKSVFDRATFQTLIDAKGPMVYINATDLSSGDGFIFSQGQFDLICSDLQPFPIAYAVAASSAVPMLLSPISLRNRAGTCGYEMPEILEEGLANRRTNPRQYRAAKTFTELHNEDKRFLHLVDGGVSDNLGLRAGLNIVEAAGGILRTAEVMRAESLPKKLVIISVNAETDPDPTIDISSAAPGFASMMNAVSGGQIRRYNFETLLLAHEQLEGMKREAIDAGHEMEVYLVEVSFENFPDEKDRRYFKRIATSFNLGDHEVDELIWAGRELLLDSHDYEKLARDVGAILPEKTERPTDN